MVQVTKVEIEDAAVNVAFIDSSTTLQAVASLFSGPNPPGFGTANYPNDLLDWQPWADTTEKFLKVWDKTNSVWIRLIQLTDLGGFADTGDIKQTLRDTAPDGWVLCDGSAYEISNQVYASLYNVIGDRFNTFQGAAAPATGFFRVPNFQDHFLVGSSATRPLMTAGGEAQVTLTENEMPTHNHDASAPNHSHSHNNPQHEHVATPVIHSHPILASTDALARDARTLLTVGVTSGVVGDTGPIRYVTHTGAGGQVVGAQNANTTIEPSTINLGINPAGINISIENEGSSQPHNNMPPHVAVNYVIKL